MEEERAPGDPAEIIDPKKDEEPPVDGTCDSSATPTPTSISTNNGNTGEEQKSPDDEACDASATPTPTPISTNGNTGEEQKSPEGKGFRKRKRFEKENDTAELVPMPTVELSSTFRRLAVPSAKNLSASRRVAVPSAKNMSASRRVAVSSAKNLSASRRGAVQATELPGTTHNVAAGTSKKLPTTASGKPAPSKKLPTTASGKPAPSKKLPGTASGKPAPSKKLPGTASSETGSTTEVPSNISEGSGALPEISLAILEQQAESLFNMDPLFEKLEANMRRMALDSPRATSEEAAGALPEGAGALPEGAGALPEGACALPEGAYALPEGAYALPEGAYALPIPTEALLQMDNNRDKLTEAMKLFKLKKEQCDKKNKSEFWRTQPVPRFGEIYNVNEPIEPNIPINCIRQEPYSLLDGFVWDTLNLEDAKNLKEVQTLLTYNYTEENHNSFNLIYSLDFLKWALKPPGWKPEWSCGIRVKSNRKLVAYINAIPASIRMHSKSMDIVEVNYLCVHKKLRNKRVTPVLIREITRLVNLSGIFQAVYTSIQIMPKPIATVHFWHRPLNFRKLFNTGFARLHKNMTLEQSIKYHRLPDERQCMAFRELTKEDCPSAHKLLNSYLTRFKLAPIFTLEEFEHWFIPRAGVVSTYVIGSADKITDLASYYYIPMNLVQHPLYPSVDIVHSFYNVATSVPLVTLLLEALILARNNGADIYYCLDVSQNRDFMNRLQFTAGKATLQYYMFNWKCPNINPHDVGLVLQ